MSRHTSRSLNETAQRALEFCWITNTSIRVVYQRFFECITTSAFIQTRSVLGNLTCMVENTDKPLFKQQLNSCISLPCNGVKWTWDKNQTNLKWPFSRSSFNCFNYTELLWWLCSVTLWKWICCIVWKVRGTWTQTTGNKDSHVATFGLFVACRWVPVPVVCHAVSQLLPGA